MKKYTKILLIGCMIITIGFIIFYNIEKANNKIEILMETVKEQEIEILSTQKQIPGIAKYITLVKELNENSNDKLTAYEITEIAKIIIIECNKNEDIGLTPSMILAVIERESNFTPDVISYADAYGLMQITRTIFELHLPKFGYADFSKSIALNPIVNIQVGISELVRLKKYWLENGNDSWMITFTSYFWGVRNTWNLLNSKTRSNLPSLEYGNGILALSKKWIERGI